MPSLQALRVDLAPGLADCRHRQYLALNLSCQVASVPLAPGNVGTPLAGELLALEASVRVAAFDPGAARAAFGDRVEIVHFDFLDPGTFGAFDGVERMSRCAHPRLPMSRASSRPRSPRRGGVASANVVFLSTQSRAKLAGAAPRRAIEDALRRSGTAWTFLAGGLLHCEPLDDARRRHPRPRRGPCPAPLTAPTTRAEQRQHRAIGRRTPAAAHAESDGVQRPRSVRNTGSRT